jgi:hypothetical protein
MKKGKGKFERTFTGTWVLHESTGQITVVLDEHYLNQKLWIQI